MALGTACATPVKEQPVVEAVNPYAREEFRTPEAPVPESRRYDLKPQRAWTSEFESPALVMGDQVYVEGPKGLLDHFSTRIADEFHFSDTKTLPEGFRQVFTVRDEQAGVEIRAYLDELEIVVFKELIVLERPGDLDVRVSVSGDAYWRSAATSEERRAAQLVFIGKVGTAQASAPR
ncbi:MAG: hypothetical protein ACI8X5_002137 [Planctomycetota bacterium]|jgi:hypothetical protein